METDFLSVDAPQWRSILSELPHDVYHTPEYVAHAARHEGGRPIAFLARESGDIWFVPLLMRPLPTELAAPTSWLDAVTPYGYAGPLYRPGTLEAAWQRFESAFCGALKASGVVSAFLRWHPLFPPPSTTSTLSTVLHGETVYVDLSRSAGELRGAVRSGHRYEIRRLAKNGFRIEWNAWDRYSQFQTLYADTMDRVGACENYFFSTDYFNDLRGLLGSALHLGCVIAPTGELASAALFTETCGIVQYHLSATAAEFHRLAPSKLILDHVREWAQQRGNRRLHLGGGLGGRADALFNFKAGFSNDRATFSTSRVIVDADHYDWLVRKLKERHSTEETQSDFFPRYRRAA